MMLEQVIFKDYIQAVKDKDAVKASTLSFLRAQLKNISIEKKVKSLQDQQVITVIKKQVKQRQDSIEQFQKGGRKDLEEKERAEFEILKSYLPQELAPEKVQEIIRQSIVATKASGLKDMGLVMKTVLGQLSGQADSKTVSDMVRTELSQAAK